MEYYEINGIIQHKWQILEFNKTLNISVLMLSVCLVFIIYIVVSKDCAVLQCFFFFPPISILEEVKKMELFVFLKCIEG